MAQGPVEWDAAAQTTGGALASDMISAKLQDHPGCRVVEGQEGGRVEGVRSKGGFLHFLSSLDTAPLHFIVWVSYTSSLLTFLIHKTGAKISTTSPWAVVRIEHKVS